MFDDRTTATIKAEILAAINEATGLSSQAGSFADSVAAPFAAQLARLYKTLPAMLSMLFPDEDSGGYIDLVGLTYFAMTRLAGTKASCTVTLTGDAGCTLPAGTEFLTDSGLSFRLQADTVIPAAGTITATLEAEAVGTAYNVAAGELTKMYVNPVGLASWSNGAATGGTDAESDAALLQRIYERRANPANGTNGWQYRQWAMAVDGVGDAKVTELSDGPGTVGITIVDANYGAASAAIVADCQAAIDAQRPLGATVAVESAVELPIALSATVVLESGTTAAEVQTAMQESMENYLIDLIQAKYQTIYYDPADDAAYTLIRNRVLALLLTIPGVINATALTLNGSTSDVSIPAGNIPVLGSVEVAV